MNEIKQVIVMRNDLNMRKGKCVAQGSHATMAFLLELLDTGYTLSGDQSKWITDNNQKKICLKVNSEEELLDIYKQAKTAGLIVHLITDSGLTEFHGVPTKTCLAIGPNDSEDIDKITGNLSLM